MSKAASDKTAPTVDGTVTINKTACDVGTGNFAGLAFQGSSNWILRTSGYLYQGNGGGRIVAVLDLKAGDQVVFSTDDTACLSVSENCTLESTDSRAKTVTFKVTADGNMGVSMVRYKVLYYITVYRNEVEEGEVYCDYTINYTFDGETIKTETGNALAGTAVEAKAPFTEDGQKYYFADDATTTLTLVADQDNVLTVDMRKAYVYSYSISNNVNDDVATGTAIEGETTYVPYCRYLLKDGVMYLKDATNKEYRYSFVATADYTATINYTETNIENVIFLKEAEDIEGFTKTTTANADVRCSNAAGGYSDEAVTITTLESGVYKVTLGVWGNAGNTFVVKAGEDQVMESATAGYWFETTSDEFTVKAKTALTIEGTASAKPLDFVYIQKTGDYVPVEAEYTINYVVGEDVVKTVKVTGVADEAIVLTEEQTADFTEGDKTYKCVSNDADGKTIAEDGSTVVTVVCEDVTPTGLEELGVEAGADVWYNLQGIRIAEPTEAGIYIHNGKKVAVRK